MLEVKTKSLSKGHKTVNGSNKAPHPVDSRESLQWFVNNFGLYVGSVRGLFLSEWADEQEVSLESAVVNLRSRGFSPLVVTGEALAKQADYVWQEAREKASFGRPIATKLELELASNDIVVIDGLLPPAKAHHLWYLLSYVLYPRAVSGKAVIFTTPLTQQEFVRLGHECPEADFGARPVNWEKFIWLLEACTINQELFRLAREECLPPMLKAEYYAYMAFRERGIEPVIQHVLGDYLLDFALVEGDRKLNIECDTISALTGHEQYRRDAQRDLVMLADGWQILRFSTAEILNNKAACADVVEDIWRVGKKRSHCGRVLTGKFVPALPEPPFDDEDQRTAIAYCGGPAVVVGGSGNGKTTCLVHRVAYLLALGISPESILIVSHSVETLKPLKAVLDGIAEKSVIARLALFSWQELGLKILKENLAAIKRKPPLKIESNHQKVIQRLFGKLKKDFDPVKLEISGEVDEFYVAGMISMYKAHLITPKMAAEDAQNESDSLIAKIYQAYEEQLQKSNRIDRDDVMSLAVQLLLDGPEIRAKYQSMFEYVLVDEYQEVTLAQDIFIRLLASPQDNLYVTGDEQETTSEHRNACPDLLSDLSLRLPQARCFVLEKNWRCHPEIVDHARQLCSNLERINIDRPYYSGWGSAPGGAIIGPQPCASQKDEIEWIVSEVQAILAAGRQPGEVAILYHHNSYEDLMKEELARSGVRFHAPHSDTSVVPDEVGDMLAYLKLVMDPDGPRAREAFERVSQLGIKEIDPKLSATIASFAEANNLSYLKAVEIYAEATADQSCRELEQLVKIIRAMHMDRLPPGESIGYLRRNRRLNDYYKSVKLPPGIIYEPLKKLQQLEEDARKFSSVSEFVKHMEGLQKEEDNNSNQDSVHIKAVLDCKGWEFSFVFLPGLAEGLFPSEKCADLEEERRICYLAFTRARERLYLSYPVEALGAERIASRFIGEARLLPLALTSANSNEELEQGQGEPELQHYVPEYVPEPVYQEYQESYEPVEAPAPYVVPVEVSMAAPAAYLPVEAEQPQSGLQPYVELPEQSQVHLSPLVPPPTRQQFAEFAPAAQQLAQPADLQQSFSAAPEISYSSAVSPVSESDDIVSESYAVDQSEEHLALEEEEQTTLPRCPSCSAFLEGNSRFCGECGYSLPERIPECSSCACPLEPSAKFCGECGTPVPVVAIDSALPEQGQNWTGKVMKFLED